jgi:ribonuclease D
MTAATPFIDAPPALAEACERWRQAPWLALDTEFLREDTYYPVLCLAQATDGAHLACVDVLALRGEPLRPLFELVAQPGLLKVFHSASQDLEVFAQLTGAVPAPLFDTQIAAALLGEGDQLGYAALVEKRLGVKLDKSLTRTNWSRRPLSEAELDYAAADVRHLAELYPRLRDELAARGRLDWLEEDCARLSDPARYRNPPELAWKRLKGLARLPAPAQAAAAALAAWREEQAQCRNRPRKWILDDDAIYRLAERRPQTATQLAGLQALPPRTLERHGAALLQVLAQAPEHETAPLCREWLPSPAQKATLKQLQERLRERAETLGLPPGLLAPRADLEALVREGAQAALALLHGWRRAVVGEDLLKLV